MAETPAGDPRRRDLEQIYTAAVTSLKLFERLYPSDVEPPLWDG